jgi:hypothetical protein
MFLILHEHNIHCQQRKLTKSLIRYQQLASHAYFGAARPVSKMALSIVLSFIYNTVFQIPNSVAVFKWNLVSWTH